MSFKKTFYKNAAVIGGFSVATTILGLASSAILARLLLPEEYGFYGIILIFGGFITQFTDAGISFSIIRTDYNLTYFRAMSNLSLYIGTFLFLLMLLLAYPIALFFDNMDLVIPTMVYSVIFLTKPLSIIPSSILMKNLDFNYIGLIKFLGTLLSIILMIVMAMLGFSYWSLIIPQIIMFVFNYYFFERRVKLGFKFYPFTYVIAAYKRAKSIIWSMSGMNIINYWSRNADKLIIGKMLGIYDLGIYGKANRMLTLTLNQTQQIFGNVLLPSLKTLDKDTKKGDYSEVRKEYLDIMGTMSILNYPIAIFFVLIPVTFTNLFWGETWSHVSSLLPYVGILILLQTINSTSGHVYILLHKEKVLFWTGLVSSIVIISSFAIGAFYSSYEISFNLSLSDFSFSILDKSLHGSNSSLEYILLFYSVGFISITLPVNLFYGFYKSFGYKLFEILKFWLPKIILTLVMVYGAWSKQVIVTQIAFGIYGAYILIGQRHNIGKVIQIIMRKIRKK